MILRFLEREQWRVPGRVVLLGSPVQGSRAARSLARLPVMRALLGQAMREAMAPSAASRWDGTREIGAIAGSLPHGFGRLFGGLGAPSDGTVLVEETRLPGATDSIVLPVSHSGMVLSPSVAAQTARFLDSGRFNPVASGRGA